MIPEAAVEAAAGAYRDQQSEMGYQKWDALPEWGREMRLNHMRAALEAALPQILAAALDDQAPVPDPPKPSRSVRDLQYGPPIPLDGRGRKDTYLMACKLCGAFIPTGFAGDGTLAEIHLAWHNSLT